MRRPHLASLRRTQKQSRGAAAVEFAVMAPIMIILTFGLIEVGRLSMIKDNAVHATREGARVGIKPFADTAAVRSRVEEELSIMGISGGEVIVNFDESNGSETVVVSVTVPVAGNTWVPHTITQSVAHIEGSTTMRRESTN